MLTTFSSQPFELQTDGPRALQDMITIREFESRLPGLAEDGFIRGSTHPSVGQEAIAVGFMRALQVKDSVATTHRGHGHVLAKGADMGRTLAEILGRRDGYCHGKGGSMHLGMADLNVLGTNGIIGAGIGLAVGAALSAQLRGTGAVVVSFFGDGATNQGTLAECFNLAAIWKLPVIFFCENNHYAQSATIEQMIAQLDLRKRGEAFGVPSFDVDGMNVGAVAEIAASAVARARRGDGPTFIVADTYRYLGHMAADTEIYRTAEDVDKWRDRDPIAALSRELIAAGILDESAIDEMRSQAIDEMDAAVEFAKSSPFPDVADAFTDVYQEQR